MTSEHNEFLEVLQEFAAEELAKAQSQQDLGGKNLPAKVENPQTFFVNPYDFTSQHGLWRERRTNLTWDTLRVMAEKNPIISAIINTRIRQIGVFSAPVSEMETTGNDQLGYKIAHKDSNKKLSKSEEQYVLDLESFIRTCGYVKQGEFFSGRDNFDTWLKKIVRDSLTFDAVVTELLPTRKGGLHSFYAVDAATIRMAMVEEGETGLVDNRYVQVLNGQIVTTYEPGELMYGIRNPTTNIRNNGYGVSELEQLVAIVTNIFNAMTHNSQFFQNGAAVKGLINIKTDKGRGGAAGEQLEAFKRAWRAMVTGTKNAWSTPILQTDGVEFVNMSSTNREMEFTQYLDFLVKIACAVYSIDPAEINFYMNGGSSGSSPMFESSQEAKLKMSKDKGLRPLLTSVSRWINHYIINPVTDQFRFVWVGIDSKDEKEVIELRTKEVASYLTVDEAREEAGREKLGEEKGGNLVLNPQYIQWLNQQSMASMMGGQGEGEEPGVKTGAEDKEQEIITEDDQEDEDVEKSLSGARKKYLRIMLDD